MSSEKEGQVEIEDYTAMFLFSYSTEHLLKKDKIRFYYALKGRDGQSGIVKSCDINHLGRAVLLVPKKFSEEVKEFLELWECKFEVKEALIKND